MRLVLVALACSIPTLALAEPCAPTPDVRALVDRQNADLDTSVDPQVYAPPAIAAWKQLLAANPGDYHVLQGLYDLEVDALSDAASFRAQLDVARHAGLDEAAALDLEARLATPDLAAAEAKYKQALARDPKSHAANYGYARLLVREKKDAEAKAPLLVALDVCPEDFASYRELEALRDKPLIAQRAPILRKLLDGGNELSHIEGFVAWWKLDFHVTPPAKQPLLQKQVATDVARLRALGGDAASLRLLDALATGYLILGDHDGGEWVKSERARLFPNARDTVNDAIEAWDAERAKKAPHTLDERHALAARALELTREWVKKWPRWSSVWGREVDALRDTPHAPMAEVETAASTIRKLGATSLLGDVAEAYDHFGIHTGEVTALVRKAMAQVDTESQRRRREHDDPKQVAFFDRMDAGQKIDVLRYSIHAEVKLGHKDVARRELAELDALCAMVPHDGVEIEFVDGVKLREHGHVALAEGHAADALADFLREMKRTQSGAMFDPELDSSARSDAQAAWKALGGSVDGFTDLEQTLSAAAPKTATATWHDASGPAPAFALRDRKGKLWRLQALAGKVVVLSFWASWCEPCKMEAPDTKELSLRLASRKDVVFLSVNVDHDASLVAPAVKAFDIRAPVLLGGGYDLTQGSHIPLILVIDRKGQLRSRATGFETGLKSGEWVSAAMAAIESAAH